MIGIFLKYGEQLVQLPVVPEVLQVSTPGTNSTMEIVKLGQVTNIGLVGLKSIKLDSFFPSAQAPYVMTKGDFRGPSFYLDFIKKVREDRGVVRLIITGTDINMLCTLESFTHDYKHGTDDVNYSLNLVEYREHRVRRVTVVNESQKTKQTYTSNKRVSEKVKPKTYTVVRNDSLWLIAKKMLGNGDRWTEIYNLNQSIIKNPNLIYTGQVLKIP